MMLYCWVFKAHEYEVLAPLEPRCGEAGRTLKIAYQTQICKREIFYRGEPRNLNKTEDTDQERNFQIKVWTVAYTRCKHRDQFYQRKQTSR